MPIEFQRTKGLIEYAKAITELGRASVLDVNAYRGMVLYGQDLAKLDGVAINLDNPVDGDAWMIINRPAPLPPPSPCDELLAAGLDLPDDPECRPQLKPVFMQVACSALESNTLPVCDSLTNCAGDTCTPLGADRAIEAGLEARLAEYLAFVWAPWQLERRLQKKTELVYRELFSLRRKLAEGLTERPTEILWGVGVLLWQSESMTIRHPLLTIPVELDIDESSLAMMIRPRATGLRLEADIFNELNSPFSHDCVVAADQWLSENGDRINPMDPEATAPLLKALAARLDARGVFVNLGEDTALPMPCDYPIITDSWVLFSRPQGNSQIREDFARFEKRFNEGAEVPPAMLALTREPAFSAAPLPHPSSAQTDLIARETHYFPLPANEEQRRVAELLAAHPGVVVCGPPGVGKTVLAANLICAASASGKTVLATSLKESALAALREKLPPAIRELSVALLSADPGSTRQVEHAVNRLAEGIQKADKNVLEREVLALEQALVDALQRRRQLDQAMGEWGNKHLAPILLDGASLTPIAAAKHLLNHMDAATIITDDICLNDTFRPLFIEADADRLREARAALGDQLGRPSLPAMTVDQLPEASSIAALHAQFVRARSMPAHDKTGQVPVSALHRLREQLQRMRLFRQKIFQLVGEAAARQLIQARHNAGEPFAMRFATLEQELGRAIDVSNACSKPAYIPSVFEESQALRAALQNLAHGKSAFGLFSRASVSHKAALGEVRLAGAVPSNAAEWREVLAQVQTRARLKELVSRYDAVAGFLGLPVLPVEPSQGATALAAIRALLQVDQLVNLEHETLPEICHLIAPIAPGADPAAICLSAERWLTDRLAIETAMEHFQTICRRVSEVPEPCKTMLRSVLDQIGSAETTGDDLAQRWQTGLDEGRRLVELTTHAETVRIVTERIAASGAPRWAARLREETAQSPDCLLPDDVVGLWQARRIATHFSMLEGRARWQNLLCERAAVQQKVEALLQDLVVRRTWLTLLNRITPAVRSAMHAYLTAIARIGKGTGKRAARYRRNAREASHLAVPAIPCWMMPHDRVAEILPAEPGGFDLVIIDEASQSELVAALPAIMRAKKIVIIGDERQVSPEGIGIEEEQIEALMQRHLAGQVALYRPLMSPEHSVYDLARVAFAVSAVGLKEHFRSAPEIIDYSRRTFYDGQIVPMRLPTAAERLSPPLVDIQIQGGQRSGDVNLAEARAIVDEIKALTMNPAMRRRTIGVVSLLGNRQAETIWQMCLDELAADVIERQQIAVGDARSFQGQEKDIVFLSMVVSPGNAFALVRNTFAQRFNVAASRARDRMVLVRSVALDDLSPADVLRRSLINHFATEVLPRRGADTTPSAPLSELGQALRNVGFNVSCQVRVGECCLDLVVEGANEGRIAIMLDGHDGSTDEGWNTEMRRQQVLQRAGWTIERFLATEWLLDPDQFIADLLQRLSAHGIAPGAAAVLDQRPRAERRMVRLAAMQPVATDAAKKTESVSHISASRPCDACNYQ